jgi:phage tail-like protein
MNTPLPAFRFMVDWGGKRVGFSEVSGLDTRAEMIEYREGSSPVDEKIAIPGLKKTGTVTLKRGVMARDNDFFQWYATVRAGTAERRDITISLLNEDSEPVMVWKLREAWPVAIEAPTLNAMASEIAIESLEIAHGGLRIETT